MINGLIIRQLNKNFDHRGWLAEFYRKDEENYQPLMGYVSLTKPGIIRGPHEHREQSDCFVFVGPGDFELHLWDGRAGGDSATLLKDSEKYLKLEVGQNNPTVVIVPPGVVHGYKCISKNDGWCINLPDMLYRGENKKGEIDEIRWEDKEDSPYKII